MTLTNRDLVELAAWRRKLHQHPEISNKEEMTAKEVVDFLADTRPDKVLTTLGGHGVAIVNESGEAGPSYVPFGARCAADPGAFRCPALFACAGEVAYVRPRRTYDDPCCARPSAWAQEARPRPRRPDFQPAEETGNGAAGVVADPRFSEIAPDFAFSLHNLPGVPFGEVHVKAGVVNCASRGMRIVLEGKTAHSSMPETGVSPMLAISELMPALPALGAGTFADDHFGMVTVTHVTMGEAVFGIAPGSAEVRATLRTRQDERMENLCASAEALVTRIAAEHGLSARYDYHEIFVTSVNAQSAVEHLRRALDEEGILHGEETLPMRASEDFGVFGHNAASAMFFLGAGERHPALHNPDYDFPDDLIPIGAKVFIRAARNLLGG